MFLPLLHPFSLPSIFLHLSPSLSVSQPDGYCVSIGNVLSVRFYGEDRQFTVKEVEPVAVEANLSLSLNTSRSLSSLLEDCLQLNMSGLTLGDGGGGEGGGEGGQGEGGIAHTPVRAASNMTAALTSTPRMDVDSAPVHSSMDFGQVLSPHSEPNLDSRPTDLLEGRMRRLGLGEERSEEGQGGREEEGGGTEGSGGEEAVVEVTVCKITSKTEVVFSEEQHSKNVSRVMAWPIVCSKDHLLILLTGSYSKTQ